MKKAFIIIVSLFLVFMCFSCTKKNTPTKEQPKQVEKTAEQEPTDPVTPDEKDPADPSIVNPSEKGPVDPSIVNPDEKDPVDPPLVNPDEKEPVDPVKPKVKHKITYIVPDYVKVDGLPTEYVEGEGLDTLLEPVVISEYDDEKLRLVFAYWYFYEEGKLEFSEVVPYISKDETRDFVLKPMIYYNFQYKDRINKIAIDILDKTIYPFVHRSCFSFFPEFHFYGNIKIDKEKKVTKVTKDDETYFKVYCDLLHIYNFEHLEVSPENKYVYGNDYYYGQNEDNEQYFIYMEKSKYEEYKNVDEFIVNLEYYNFSPYVDQKTYEVLFLKEGFPQNDKPLATIEKDGCYLEDYDYFDFYPVVDGVVYLQDQSKFSKNETLKPYICETYKHYINKNLKDNPTFEDFEAWLKDTMTRLYERGKLGDWGICG